MVGRLGARLESGVELARTVKNMALGFAPWLPGDRRHGVRSISPDELTHAIAAHVPGARVEQVVVQHDSRSTTDRARLYLTWNEAGVAAGLPATAFAKGTPSTVAPRVINAAFGLCESEVRFYNELQPAVADMTLTPYVARLGAGGRFAVAVNTIESVDATFFETGDTVSLAHAEAMMDALARLHSAYWCSSRFDTDLSWITVYSRRPGWPIARGVMPLYNKIWLQKRDDVPLEVRQLTALYLRNKSALERVWERLPPTLCHGDTHAANTFLRVDGSVGIFDWQQPHRMHGMRDVSYFIGWSLDPATRRMREHELISRYLEGLRCRGVSDTPTHAEAFRLHRLFMIDAWNSVWPALAMYNDDKALEDRLLGRLCETLLDLETADALRSVLVKG